MSRGPTTFRQRDLERALRAARAAGFDRVEFNLKTGVFEFRHGTKAALPRRYYRQQQQQLF
jgi:predicted metalloprotease